MDWYHVELAERYKKLDRTWVSVSYCRKIRSIRIFVDRLKLIRYIQKDKIVEGGQVQITSRQKDCIKTIIKEGVGLI